MSDKQQASRVVVIGLGRFGSSLAMELTARGTDVLGIDSNPKIVQQYADELTHVVVADTTDGEVMRQLGVDEFQRAVVGIGTDLEASILTTALLVDLEIPNIWAKAISRQHGRILERIGAHHVVLPEHEMGERVATSSPAGCSTSSSSRTTTPWSRPERPRRRSAERSARPGCARSTA